MKSIGRLFDETAKGIVLSGYMTGLVLSVGLSVPAYFEGSGNVTDGIQQNKKTETFQPDILNEFKTASDDMASRAYDSGIERVVQHYTDPFNRFGRYAAYMGLGIMAASGMIHGAYALRKRRQQRHGYYH